MSGYNLSQPREEHPSALVGANGRFLREEWMRLWEMEMYVTYWYTRIIYFMRHEVY